MNILKKDWLYPQKLFLLGCGLLVVLFWVLSLFLGRHQDYDVFMYGLYQSFYMMSVFFMASYPTYALINICPKKGELLKAPMITVMLPLSRKQLFWNNIKPWLIIYPMYVIIASLLYRPYFIHAEHWADSMTFPLVFISLGVLMVSFFTMTLIIESLRKEVGLFKIVNQLFWKSMLVNLIGFGICVGLKLDFGHHLTWLFVMVCSQLIYSLIEFFRSYHHIEHVYQ